MKLDSKLFDRIRIRPRHFEEPERASRSPALRLGGLRPARHLPRAQGQPCDRRVPQLLPRARPPLQHGVQLLRRHEARGDGSADRHRRRRPTAARAGALAPRPALHGPRMPRGTHRGSAQPSGVNDPLNIFARYAWQQATRPAEGTRVKPMHEPDRRAFETLGFRATPRPTRSRGLQGAGEDPPPRRQWRRQEPPKSGCAPSSPPTPTSRPRASSTARIDDGRGYTCSPARVGRPHHPRDGAAEPSEPSAKPTCRSIRRSTPVLMVMQLPGRQRPEQNQAPTGSPADIAALVRGDTGSAKIAVERAFGPVPSSASAAFRASSWYPR